jgi:VanZ family protein
MMLVIFLASASSTSFSSARKIIEPIVRWFYPGITEHGIRTAILVVRKSGHMGEYAMFSFLVWRALRKPHRNDPRPWTWREPAVVLLAAALYAMSDEWHQTFVPHRVGAVTDVLIDLSGATIAMALVWCVHRRRTKAAKTSVPSTPE